MDLESLLEKIKSLFRKSKILKERNEGNIVKKPFRGPSQSELEDLSYATKQPDYGPAHIKTIEELKTGSTYEYITEKVIGDKIEKRSSLVKILGLNKQTKRIKIKYNRTKYESEHDAFYFGLFPSHEARHKNLWKKDSYLMRWGDKEWIVTPKPQSSHH